MALLNLMNIGEPWLLTFSAVLIRVGLFMVFLPFWGDMILPASVRILVAVGVSLALTPLAPIDLNTYPDTLAGLGLGIIAEALFTFSIAFLVRLIFGAVQTAGQIAGEQMGFAVANVLSPDQSSQFSIIAQFKYVLAVILFFALNFHLLLFQAVAKSFELVPVFQPQMSESVFTLVNDMARVMFSISVQMSAPILATMIFVNVALGLLNKAAPQVNVLMESFPTRIMMGLFMLGTILTAIARLLNDYFLYLDRAINAMVHAWA